MGTTRGRRVVPNIAKEVTYIVTRATQREARVVGLGPLIFFSTETGDAWLLDHEDELALRLARDGSPQPVHITESKKDFVIQWTSRYRIDGEVMTFYSDGGRPTSVRGYPTTAIMDTVRRARGARGAV
jgi:hypothetical protein